MSVCTLFHFGPSIILSPGNGFRVEETNGNFDLFAADFNSLQNDKTLAFADGKLIVVASRLCDCVNPPFLLHAHENPGI